MKRTENCYDNHQSKRQKLDCGASHQNFPTDSARPISDWDDDLSGDQLEEVCVFAELSQAPRISVFKHPESINGGETHLSAENDRLKESLKVKEGEIGILRSQLKQNQTSKQNDALKNLRTIDTLEEKHKLSLESLKKQVEQLQSEIEFKNLEVCDLTEKCKQLESKSLRVSFVQPSPVIIEEKRSLFSLSQAINSKIKPSKKLESLETKPLIHIESPKRTLSEGEKLSRQLDPSLFRLSSEPTIIPMYQSNSSYGESLDHAKSDKYKWTGLPKLESKMDLLNPLIMKLLQSDCFECSTLTEVYNITLNVFKSLVNLLTFLNNLPMNIDADKTLLEDIDPGGDWTLADILSNELMRPNEKAVEVRRIIGIISCISISSDYGLETFAKIDFLTMIKDIVQLISKLMRPLEFCGISVAVLFFLQIMLAREDKKKICSTTKNLSKTIINEIILSRPKLDVLNQVTLTFAAGSYCEELTSLLCKKSPIETNALYMDSRLQQALFFTREACPLKLLQIQVKTLAHLCNSTSALLSITNSFIFWFHSLLSNSLKSHTWLFPENEKCCNILECFCYLLTLLIPLTKIDKQCKIVFEKGILVLKNCCKGHKKKLKQTTLKLLPSTIRGSNVLDIINSKAREAALYIITEYESDVITQETVANTFNCSDS